MTVLRNTIQIGALALITALSGPAIAAGPFSGLEGTWSGSGSVKLENGATERLKCKGYYTSKGGGGLGMAINCGNASFKINMRATLASSGSQITGSWEEREFNQAGEVAGKATNSGFSLKFSGAIAGSMTVSTTGNSQTVSISTGGPGFTGVNLQFAKSS